MYTVLELPLDWRPSLDLAIEPLPLVPIPSDPAGWRTALLARDLPPRAELRLLDESSGTSALGWPMTLATAEVVADGRVIEVRIAASYRFVDTCGAALVRARVPGRFATDLARLEAILASARPAFVETSLCLAELLPPEEVPPDSQPK